MRINAIEIKNYRHHKDLKMEFPNNGDHDLHLIIAKNGVGKTNLLNSIAWCFYEKEPHLNKDEDKKTSDPKIIYNLTAQEEAIQCGQEFFEVSVKIHTEDNINKMIFERKCIVKSDTGFTREPSFSAITTSPNGESTVKEGQEAIDVVNSYVPHALREYFFFDGEQLFNYFDDRHEKNSIIRESIHKMSQVQSLTTSKGRLKSIIKDYQTEATKLNPDIKSLNAEEDAIAEKINNNEKDLDSYIEENIKAERQMDEINEYLRGQSSIAKDKELFDEKEARKSICDDEYSNLVKRLGSFVREYTIQLGCYESNLKVLNVIKEMHASGQLPTVVDKDLLKKILQDHRCIICHHDLEKEEEALIQEMYDKLQVTNETAEIFLQIKDYLRDMTIRVSDYSNKKALIISKMSDKEKEITELAQQMDTLYAKFANSDVDEINNQAHELKRLKTCYDFNLTRIGASEAALKKLRIELDEKQKFIKKAMEKESLCVDINKKCKQSEEIAIIVEKIETEMMDEVRKKMQEVTMSFFQKLVWKKDTFKSIELDADYKLKLYHVSGQNWINYVSAAEKALLALSYTLALHNLTGYNTLLFIDTPVSRVSDDNRINFAETLIEVSKSKQIIMTLTPSEYKDEIESVLKSMAATNRTLISNEKYTLWEEK